LSAPAGTANCGSCGHYADGAVLSLLMNNIAAGRDLDAAVSGLAHRSRVSPSRLLMPLAFATILGGMATLFTTTNIVVSGILRGQDLPGFSVLDFARWASRSWL